MRTKSREEGKMCTSTTYLLFLPCHGTTVVEIPNVLLTFDRPHQLVFCRWCNARRILLSMKKKDKLFIDNDITLVTRGRSEVANRLKWMFFQWHCRQDVNVIRNSSFTTVEGRNSKQTFFDAKKKARMQCSKKGTSVQFKRDEVL